MQVSFIAVVTIVHNMHMHTQVDDVIWSRILKNCEHGLCCTITCSKEMIRWGGGVQLSLRGFVGLG